MEMHVFEASLYDTQYQFFSAANREGSKPRSTVESTRVPLRSSCLSLSLGFFSQQMVRGGSRDEIEKKGNESEAEERQTDIPLRRSHNFLMPQLKIHKHELLI
jgi:hypothetical protein